MGKASQKLLNNQSGDRDELEFAVCGAIALAARRIHARFAERLRPEGHAVARWKALRLIAESKSGITQRELADLAGTSAPTMVKIVDELEERGHVRRLPLAGDRRANLLFVEPAGLEAMRECDEVAKAFRHELLGEIDTEELEATLALLTRISARLATGFLVSASTVPLSSLSGLGH